MPTAPRKFSPPRINDRDGREFYREWYKLPVWKGRRGLRELQLRLQPLCEECLTAGLTEPATDVDHIQPHRGNWSLFTATDNLRSLCHACHSRKTGRGL